MNRLKKIIFLSFFILLSIISILFYVFYQDYQKKVENKIIEPTLMCGTKNPNENQSKGRKLFNENCAACHNIRKKYIGPNLIKTDSVIFFKWLSKKDFIKPSKKTEYGLDYHQKMWNEKFSNEEIYYIYQYSRFFDE